MQIKNVFYLRATIKPDPQAYAELLNTMGEYLESHYTPPNHWDESKRVKFYRDVDDALSLKADRFISKLSKL